MPIATTLRIKAAVALAAMAVLILVSLPEDMFPGQDPAGNAMLAGLVGLAALAIAVVLGFQTWRAGVTHRGSLDRLTLALCRAPLTVAGLLLGAAILAIVSGV